MIPEGNPLLLLLLSLSLLLPSEAGVEDRRLDHLGRPGNARSPCPYMYVYIYIYIYVYMYIDIYRYIHIYNYLSLSLSLYIYIYICNYSHVRAQVCPSPPPTASHFARFRLLLPMGYHPEPR